MYGSWLSSPVHTQNARLDTVTMAISPDKVVITFPGHPPQAEHLSCVEEEKGERFDCRSKGHLTFDWFYNGRIRLDPPEWPQSMIFLRSDGYRRRYR